jgi:hypothetical protein
VRVPLRDDLWVDLRERISHGEDKAIRRARVVTRDNLEEHAADDITVMLRVFIEAWNMVDAKGVPLTLEHTNECIERMPADLADIVVGKATDLYLPATVPNSPTPASSANSDSPPAE